MKKLLLLAGILMSFSSYAQTPSAGKFKNGEISGKIIDKNSKNTLPYVTIIVKDAENKTITGGITDANGIFNVKQIMDGENTVEIQFIGYKTVIKKISITKSNYKLNLGTIELTEEASQLNEVEIVAETSTVTQKIDRKVINVGKDLTSVGTTASELLNNVQSVSVDSQTGNISLRGNENVRILVDGKPTNISAAQLLKQIPSTSIKSVELITNPSAKYNPEGMSGIINIVLHKNSNQGFNGTVNTGITQGENTKFNGSLDMNYKTGGVNFFTNYGYNTGKSSNTGYVNRRDNNSLQNFSWGGKNTSNLLKLGADITINDKNSLSIYTIQNISENESDGSTIIRDNGNLVVDSFNTSDSENNAGTYNLYYKSDFNKEGHNLVFEANYSDSKNPEDAISTDIANPLNNFNNYTNDIKNTQDNSLFNLDYTNPLSEKGKLELGLEARINTADNNSKSTQDEIVPDGNGGFITRETPESSFDYKRNIYSAYATYSHQFNKISLQTGARFEQYEVDGTFTKGAEKEFVKKDIFSVYPSAFLTFNPSEKNQFQVSYSRRVDRPSISQVNPIREWSTPRVTSVGNPELDPQFTNSYELNYTRQLKNGSLTFGSFFRKVNDNINRKLSIDPTDNDKVLLSYANTESNNRYGLEMSSSYKIAEWWRANASMDFYVQNESGNVNGTDLEVTNNSFNARLSNSFKVSKTVNLQLFSMYRGGGESIQFKVEPMWMVNLGGSIDVLNGNGTISLRVNDIFEGMKFAFESVNPYPSNGQFNWESRTAYLGFMYKFGKGKNKAKSRKSRDNNETQGGGGFM